MGHQGPPAREVQKHLQRLGLAGGVGHHLVGDAGEGGDLFGDGLARFDEGVELLHHFAVFHQNRADLGEVLHPGVQTGGLGVKDAELPIQGHILDAVDTGDHVVHKIGLAAIDQLEVGILLVDVIGGQHGLWVTLTDAVVGDGDGRVTHAVGQADNPARVAEAVHAGELGVQVELHPLFGGVVLPAAALHTEDVVGVDDIVVLVFVVGAVAPDQEGGALFQALPLGAVLPFLGADLQVDGARIVGDGNGVDLAEIALDLGGEDVAPDHALAALAPQVLEGGEVLGLEHLAVEDGHRLVGQVQPLHLDGGGAGLGLELYHRGRGLPFQLFHQLLLLAGVRRQHQMNGGLYPGVVLDLLGQEFVELQLGEELGAGVHPDGDLLALDFDAAPVQKAVDGHAVPLHFLENIPQSRFVQHGISKTVVDAQLVALIVGLQRRQKPRTQALVQRRGTLQCKYDPLLLPQHTGVGHQHAAKTGRKIRVRHELGPELGYKWFHRLSPLMQTGADGRAAAPAGSFFLSLGPVLQGFCP